jgi:hypothetical protein
MAGGAALLIGGAAATQAAPTPKITICHFTGSESNPYNVLDVSEKSLQGHLNHGDFRYYSSCCSNLVLSGGPSPTDAVTVDDKLDVYVNDIEDDDIPWATRLFSTDVGFDAIPLPPGGGMIRVVARDLYGGRYTLSPLYVHCLDTGASQQIYAGYDQCCELPVLEEPFVDFVTTIAV